MVVTSLRRSLLVLKLNKQLENKEIKGKKNIKKISA